MTYLGEAIEVCRFALAGINQSKRREEKKKKKEDQATKKISYKVDGGSVNKAF